MKRSYSSCILASAVFATGLTVAARAQTGFGRTMSSDADTQIAVQGFVQSDSLIPAGYMVELQSSGGHIMGLRTDVAPNGSFTFAGVPAGTYWMNLTDMSGNVIASEYVVVGSNMTPLTLKMPKRRVERPVSGTISVERLQHKVPRKAHKEFEKAMSADRKRDTEKAVQHLRNAIAIDPEYMEAHNNLGARYLNSGKPDQALREFNRALELDPHAIAPQVNAATSLLMMKRNVDAEQAARKALDLDSTDLRAHYMLGLSLIAQGKFTPEAGQSLRRAAEKFPRANLASAEVCLHTGDVEGARTRLKSYLDSGASESRSEVKQWLSGLNSATFAKSVSPSKP